MSAQEHLNGQLFEGSIKGGTPQLFPSAPHLTGRAKYPRGYTPERMREVTAAVPIKRPNTMRDHEYPPRVRQALARSTIPVEHMRDTVDDVWVGRDRNDPYGSLNGALGTFEPARSTAQGPKRAITISTDAGDATVIHEYGHAVSNHTGTAHSAYGSPYQMGAEEAYAENYAERHFRDRRGRPAQEIRRTGQEWVQNGKRGGEGGGFMQGWQKKRGEGSPLVAKTREERIAHTERLLNSHPLLPPGHVKGQLPLLEGDMTGSHETGDERVKWDYTSEQKAAGLRRDNPEEAYLSPRSAKVRAARLPKGTEVHRAVDWDHGGIRRALGM